MNRNGRRSSGRFLPRAEGMELRSLLSTFGAITPVELYRHPLSFPVERPNTPVLPYGAGSAVATFIDPSVRVVHGAHVAVAYQTYIAPYATLNATTGAIRIGTADFIGDNATIISNPTNAVPTTSVIIADNVAVGYGATILGPSTLGAYTPFGAKQGPAPVSIGANAVIDGATIQPGVVVGALARVGPGVTVPSGFRVLPGANVTTNAQASNPALGMVVPITAADLTTAAQVLTDAKALASGYTTLYQGNSATGTSPGVPTTTKGVFNGNLAAVEGTSPEPGKANVSFEPASNLSPTFPGPRGFNLPANIPTFRARVTGEVTFKSRAAITAHHLGRSNSFRGDEGQPITFNSAASTGRGVTINSPLGTYLTIGQNLQAQNGAVLLGGKNPATIGDNVTIGSGAVVDDSSIGSGSVIGARSYVANSTLPAGSIVPAGAIIINGVRVGTVQS